MIIYRNKYKLSFAGCQEKSKTIEYDAYLIPGNSGNSGATTLNLIDVNHYSSSATIKTPHFYEKNIGLIQLLSFLSDSGLFLSLFYPVTGQIKLQNDAVVY